MIASGAARLIRVRRLPSAAAVALVAPLTSCGQGEEVQSILYPTGTGAGQIASLWWLLFALGAAVYLVVMGLLAWALLRRRAGEETPRAARPVLWIGIGGILIPTLILTIVFAATLRVMTLQAAMEDGEHALEIEVVGHRWWWEVKYHDEIPQRRLTTANEIHIPVGRTVRVKLESRDIIHSFWVPNLDAKVDMIPGRTRTLSLRAEEPGVFRGQCAEYCGLQHANMAMLVVAMPPEEYATWYDRQLLEAPEPTTPLALLGQQVFLDRPCALCHTVRGTSALATVGPDLTHLASRRTLAAGAVPNTRGHLGGWITHPQAIKPGSLMPNIHLSAEELRALLAYLETLR